MAMPGTHVLFALEIAPALGVLDRETYISGSVYPDTRNTTGIARDKTHGADCPRLAPGDDVSSFTEFEKGWANHLYYDEQVAKEQRPLVPLGLVRTGLFNDYWVYITAMKVFEDQASCERLRSIGCWHQLSEIRATEKAHREDSELLSAYYQATRECYMALPTKDAYREFFVGMRVPVAKVQQILMRVEEIEQDQEKAQKILSFYDKMLKRFV